MYYNEGFIGNKPNITLEFSGGDQEYMYVENLATQPDDWYYRFHEIVYDYNSYGHRSKNVDEIDLNNYILFAGCSHTEGIGLELEKTFPYLTASYMGMDYYNLALGGSGIDVMTHNLVVWLNTVKKLPKALVILWPEPTRFSLKDDDGVILHVPSVSDGDIARFMVLGEEIGFFDSVKDRHSVLIDNLYKATKIVNLGLHHLCRRDLARDFSHAGMFSNETLARKLAATI